MWFSHRICMNNNFDYNDKMFVCIEKDNRIICKQYDSYKKAMDGGEGTLITGDGPCVPIHYPRRSVSALITVDKRVPNFLNESIIKYKLRSLAKIKLI